jgi:arylsulfatase A
MKKRTHILSYTIVVVVGLVIVLSGCNPNTRTFVKQPNIVFILVDDLGSHQLGCYGSTFYETSSIDKLAREGMKFNNAYAASTVCSPTRASIMTGKYPARLHLTDYIPGNEPQNTLLSVPGWTKQLLSEEITIAEALKSAGYATGHFGKWHLNKDKNYESGRPGDPDSQGFDDVLCTHKPGAGPASPYANDWHHVREITERALSFIEKNRGNPFFCYIAHNSIHAPEIEKQEQIDKYKEKFSAETGGINNPVQAAMLETLDESIGILVKRIADLGLEEKTVVVFFSDNGQLGVKSGRPYRGSKGDLYEGGIRMPLIIRWPGIVKPGSTCEALVISNDFFPTFSELGNVKLKVKDIDGMSLIPLLLDPENILSSKALYWHYPHYHSAGLGPQGAIRQGPYKLIEWYENSIYGTEGAMELYDLEMDPAEQQNLADSLPGLATLMSHRLQAWRIQVDAQNMEKRK